MLVCVRSGMPPQPVNRVLLRTADRAGMLYAGAGFSLLYAALDQGNRLDWLNSGLINSLLLGGTLLLIVFVVTSLLTNGHGSICASQPAATCRCCSCSSPSSALSSFPRHTTSMDQRIPEGTARAGLDHRRLIGERARPQIDFVVILEEHRQCLDPVPLTLRLGSGGAPCLDRLRELRKPQRRKRWRAEPARSIYLSPCFFSFFTRCFW
jgi:hypothetical protein